MATITKTSTNTWQGGTSWDGAATDTADAYVTNTASPTTSFSIGTTSLFLSSLTISSTAASPISTTGGNGSTVLSSCTAPSGYALYIAPNKTFNITQTSQLSFTAVQGFSTHTVYIDTDARLNANAGLVGGQPTANVIKSGLGTWRVSATENGSLNSVSNLTSFRINQGILLTGSGLANPLGTGTLTFDGGTLQASLQSRSYGNATVSVLSGGGTITVDSGITATFTGTTSNAGTLTIARTGSGNLIWNNNISCPLNVTGLLTMGASNNLSGATLSGSGGTIAMSNGSISSDAPTFTGDVTGTFTYNATDGRTFGGNAQGAVTVTGGTLTATASNSGTIANISGGAGVTLSSNGTFTGDLAGYTYLGSSPSAGVATFSMVGPTATFARNLSLTNGSRVRLSQSATLTSPVVVANIDTTTTEMTVEDATTNTFTGSYISDVSSGSDNISAFAEGTLVLSGSVYGIKAGRRWNLNGTSASYTGTIKLTGTGFTGAAPASLKRGKLVMQRAGAIGLAGGLTIDSGATLACATPSAAYAAQLSGNLTLSAGATMKFGTA